MKTNVGELIKEKRTEKGLTQAKLAEIIGSDPYYVSKIETGKRKPGSKYLIALSNALEIPSDYFLGIESNIVLHECVSEFELQLSKISAKDRECILNIVQEFIDRCSKIE